MRERFLINRQFMGAALLGCLMLQAGLCLSAEIGVPEKYRQLWSDPALVKRIDEGIEKNRKGDAGLRVVDEKGKPVAGAVVTVRHKRHDFLFGCNAFVLGQMDTPELNRKYEESFTRICNFATVPFYWQGTEPKKGVLRYQEGAEFMWRRPPPDRFIPFGKKYGLTLKAHPMLWHEHNPSWIPKDPEELKTLYRKRFKEIAGRYAQDIEIWEVTNESSGCHKTFPLYSDDRAYVEWAFKEAAPLFGDDNLLMINDFTKFNDQQAGKNYYFDQISKLLDQGARVQGIGVQFHIWFAPRLMERYLAAECFLPNNLLDTYESYAALNLPVYITEITVPTPQQDNGEELQAEVVENLYRLWFSVPNMKGVTYWNLGDSMAYNKENTAMAGLVDKEINPKKSYKVLDKLINQDWKTNLDGRSDANGQFAFRGFYGTYEVEVRVGNETKKHEIHLSAGDTKREFKLKQRSRNQTEPM